MDIYEFNLDDLKTLEALLQITTEISNIYDKLCVLEINNQKDSKEYQNLLEKLNKLIEKENQEYKNKNFSHKDCIKFLKLLEFKTFIPVMDNKIITTLKHNNNRIIRRIMINLLTILDKNKGFHQLVLDNESSNPLIKNIPQDEILKEIENSTKIQAAIDDDIHSVFLSILEEAIEYKSNANYKEELIKDKYCLLFAHKKMESMYINSKFNISNIIYTSSKIIMGLLHHPEISYNLIKAMKLKSIANYDVNDLLNLHDSEYNDHNTNLIAIITAYHLRATLSLMDPKEVNNFNQEIHNILESPKYLSKHQNDRISENLIIDSFKCFKKDREKIRTLSITK